jgi:hypothetical protein
VKFRTFSSSLPTRASVTSKVGGRPIAECNTSPLRSELQRATTSLKTENYLRGGNPIDAYGPYQNSRCSFTGQNVQDWTLETIQNYNALKNFRGQIDRLRLQILFLQRITRFYGQGNGGFNRSKPRSESCTLRPRSLNWSLLKVFSQCRSVDSRALNKSDSIVLRPPPLPLPLPQNFYSISRVRFLSAEKRATDPYVLQTFSSISASCCALSNNGDDHATLSRLSFVTKTKRTNSSLDLFPHHSTEHIDCVEPKLIALHSKLNHLQVSIA